MAANIYVTKKVPSFLSRKVIVYIKKDFDDIKNSDKEPKGILRSEEPNILE